LAVACCQLSVAVVACLNLLHSQPIWDRMGQVGGALYVTLPRAWDSGNWEAEVTCAAASTPLVMCVMLALGLRADFNQTAADFDKLN